MTTQDTSPQLSWTDDGEPRSGRFGDVYFSKDDGLAETRAVFLAGCGLPDAFAGRRLFRVAELGFGTGLNIAALLHLWKQSAPAGARLHVFSVEGFPLGADEARRALSNWPELAEETQALLAAWPAGTPGFHRLELPQFNAVVDLAVGDVTWALEQWDGQADAWFLDGFSPALNPGMWSPEVMDLIAARSAPGARVATFTVAGAVRRGLAERGFTVEKRPGHGRKRERLEAWLDTPAVTEDPRAAPSVAIIGAGIAGASVARALKAQGVDPVVFEAEQPGAGGSGFPAGLVTPRIDAGDAAIAALHAQTLTRAVGLYEDLPGAVTGRGVLQLAQAERDANRFAKVADQPIWPAGTMSVLDAAAIADRQGEPAGETGLMMAGARAIRPKIALQAWLADVEVRQATVARLSRHEDQWHLYDSAGTELLRVDAVVLTAGWGNAALLEGHTPAPRLSPVRGQADWAEAVDVPATAWGGYAAPTGDAVLFGATHDRGEVSTEVRDSDRARNLATLAARLPGLAAQVEGRPIQSRAAVRATTPDRLPLAGEIAGGLFILGGLGSRGLCVAPLLGEHIAARLTGAPSPLPRDLSARVDPARPAAQRP